MSDLLENKKKLREEFRRRRDAFVAGLDVATRNLAFRRPPSPLARLIDQSTHIGLYSSVASEAPTANLIDHLTESGKSIALPVVTDNSPLIFRQVETMDLLATGYHDIPEPAAHCPAVIPDLIIAPMIAFDRSMQRLGQGGGHYDRTFSEYPDALRIGMAWSVQEADSVPIEPHDVTLHMIITESEIIQQVNLTS